MKDNRYTRAITSVEISSEVLEAGLRYAVEKRDEVIVMKKRKTAYWKIAAACLGIVIATAAVFSASYQHKQQGYVESVTNAFIIKANAEELTQNSEVVIGALDSVGGGFGTLDNGNFEIVKHLEFPIICEGTGIESVTYSLPKHSDGAQMTFVLQKSFEEIVEHDGDINTGYKTIFMPDTYAALSYTVPYEKLPSEDDFGKRENGYHSDPVILDLYFEADPSDFGYNTAEDLFYDIDNGYSTGFENSQALWADIFVKTAEKYSEEMKVSVTASFEDGTSKTETIQLSCLTSQANEDYTMVKVIGTIE